MPTFKAGNNPSRLRGFTLLELLVVLVLIALAVSLAVASVDRIAGRMNERRWADQTLHALMKLRNQAMVQRKPVTVPLADLLVLPPEFRLDKVGETSGSTDTLYFYPDGTMDEAQFDLVMPREGRRRYRLKRFTGQIDWIAVP